MNERRIRHGRQILQWIQDQGIVFFTDRPEREVAKLYLQEMPTVFPELVNKLSAVYLYRQGEQGDPNIDGILWRDVTKNAGTLYAVGLSVEALDRGPSYFQFLFIHEISHIIVRCVVGEHNRDFYQVERELLARYDRITGANLSARREVSEEDRAARAYMQEAIRTGACPAPPKPSTQIRTTVPHHGKAWRDRHRR